MKFARFWDIYQLYSATGAKERQPVEADGARFELYVSMGTPRARFQPTAGVDVAAPAFAEALERLAKQHRLNVDFRDDSYVVMDDEGSYLGRVRPAELLFTPDRFLERQPLLEDLIGLY